MRAALQGKVGGKSVYDWSIDAKADPVDASANKSSWEALVASLPSDEPRFVVFDFTDTKADGRVIAKLVLIKWCAHHLHPHHTPPYHHCRTACTPRRCPDSVNFRIKPVIGASYQTLKEKLAGLGKDVQATDPADLGYDAVKAALA